MGWGAVDLTEVLGFRLRVFRMGLEGVAPWFGSVFRSDWCDFLCTNFTVHIFSHLFLSCGRCPVFMCLSEDPVFDILYCRHSGRVN